MERTEEGEGGKDYLVEAWEREKRRAVNKDGGKRRKYAATSGKRKGKGKGSRGGARKELAAERIEF